jgi:hypothetical protein
VRVARTATLYSELFETTQQNKKGSHRLPFLHSVSLKNLAPEMIVLGMIVGFADNSAIAVVAIDGYDDAKPADGGAGPSNAGDGAGRATRRDWCLVAARDALP